MNENKHEEEALHAAEANGLLTRWAEGDKSAYNALISLLHQDLQIIARRHVKRERVNHTLETDDLVSKLYIKLLGSQNIPWTDYAHFLRTAARTMGQLLIDHARGWQKRATGKAGMPLPEPDARDQILIDQGKDLSVFQMVQLNEAIEKMETYDPTMARVAELRIVLGLTLHEVSEILDLPINKVKREWLISKKVLANIFTNES